jgi:hypothetical protein
MAAKKRAAKNPRYGKAKTKPSALHSRSVASIAAQNLINMVAVFIASGSDLAWSFARQASLDPATRLGRRQIQARFTLLRNERKGPSRQPLSIHDGQFFSLLATHNS